jgi:hypothetical protein
MQDTPPTNPDSQHTDWQQQAQSAAQRIAELEAKAGELQQQITDANSALTTAQRKHQVERALLEAGAIDLDAAATLFEAQFGKSAASATAADLHKAINELVARKHYLFRPPPPPSSVMAGTPAAASTRLEDAAATARESGDRRALLQYLRLRRTA